MEYTKLWRDSSRGEYDSWKARMLQLLGTRSLSRFVDGNHPPPRKTNSQAHREWRRNDGLVKNLIVNTLSRELIPVVIARKTSRDVWVQLEAMYSPDSQQPFPPPPFGILPGEDGGYRWMPLRLYKSALEGDWDKTRAILDQDPEAVKARCFANLNTALHIAVGTGKAIPYLQNLVAHNAMTLESLALTDDKGRNALHVAAQMGNLAAATELVGRRPDLLLMPDNFGHFPVVKAAQSRHRLTVVYFIDNTTDPTPYAADNGVLLVNTLIDTGFLDIALTVIDNYPDLARRKHSSSGHSALRTIALKSAAFPSGAKFNFCKVLFIKLTDICVCVLISAPHSDLHEQRVKHDEAVEFVKRLCVHMAEGLSEREASSIYVDAMLKAAEVGVHEVIEEIVEIFPQAIYSMEINSRRNFFHMAVENRCESVFNLIYQMSDFKYEFLSIKDDAGNTLLHRVAHLAPPHKLNLVASPALQLQRELQWFKEVAKFVKADDSERLNYEGRTPEMIFTEEHGELRAAGEKWMKDAASSCSIPAALITTIMFTVLINVRGGKASSDDKSSFLGFAVFAGLSILASSISLLLFLSILTSRCAEEEFLYTLPRRLNFGLNFLYFSIAFMMVALFWALLYLERQFRTSPYSILPLAILLCIPVGFLYLQRDVLRSTFGRSVFGKQSARPFH